MFLISMFLKIWNFHVFTSWKFHVLINMEIPCFHIHGNSMFAKSWKFHVFTIMEIPCFQKHENFIFSHSWKFHVFKMMEIPCFHIHGSSMLHFFGRKSWNFHVLADGNSNYLWFLHIQCQKRKMEIPLLKWNQFILDLLFLTLEITDYLAIF